uniref:Nucleoporin Nup188 N-terminal domain-containing protein n=1 Tax=Romanomermis culicivorax TaxID=13658 RepID=A0A915HW45_ROMCU
MNLLDDYITINWRVFLNGWQILLSKLKATCDLGDRILVFDLIGTILRLGNAKTTRLLTNFLQEALLTLKNIPPNEVDGNFPLIESSLRCLSYCSDKFAYELFNDLRYSLFGDSCFTTIGSLRCCGLYQRTFYSHESVVGKYNFTLSMLRLFEKCIPRALTVEDAEFCSILSFVMDSIFVNHPQWFFVNTKDKNEIGLICLKIAHKCTTDLSVDYKLPGRIPLLTTTCCRSFLYGEARNRLLSIIVDFARTNNGFNDLSIAIELGSQVSLAVSIMAHLLEISLFYMPDDSKSENSLKLPPLLSEILCKESQCSDLLFPSLGSLFNVRFSDQLPILGLICLKKFAEVFPSSILYGFGSHIDDFCDIFFKRLQSPSEKTELRILSIIMDIISSCLKQALFHSWQPVLKRYNVLLNAVEFFKHCCFSGQLSLDIAMSVCNLFHYAISNADDVDFIKSSNFCQFVNSRLPSYIFDKLDDKHCRTIFNILLDFHSTLVNKGAKLHENASTFLCSWEEYFSKDSLDYEACKCVCQPCFSTNVTLSEDNRLTFGHLLVCIQLCITSLRKTDHRSSSPSIGRSCMANPLSFLQTKGVQK